MTLLRIVRGITKRVALYTGMWLRRFRTPVTPVPSHGKVLVNLGCGTFAHPDYINVDARPYAHVHHVHSIESLPMFPDNSIDLLYASHVLEHIDRKQVPLALKEWFRALKPGGVVRFGVPDFDNLIDIYVRSGREVDSIVNQLLGQGAPYDDHHTIWNFRYAERLLTDCGFVDIRRWDTQTAEYHGFEDKTTRVAEVDGMRIPISLNIEATKPML